MHLKHYHENQVRHTPLFSERFPRNCWCRKGVCVYVCFFFFELLHGLVSRTLAKPFVDLTPFFLQTQFLKRNFCKNWALTNQIIPLFTSFFVRDELNNLHIKHNILIILPFLLKLKINFNETQKFDSKLLEPNISQGKLL